MRIRGVRPARLHWTLTRHVVDSLSSGLAVLNSDGKIILTNDAWKRLARENAAGDTPNFGVGRHYLEVCSSVCGVATESAKDIQVGLEEVLSGARERFSLEHLCPLRKDSRWFL